MMPFEPPHFTLCLAVGIMCRVRSVHTPVHNTRESQKSGSSEQLQSEVLW